MSHNPSNDDCPWNDPETMMHPASRGLGCSCPATEPAIEVADEAAARAVMAEREAIIQIIEDDDCDDYDSAAQCLTQGLIKLIRARPTPVWPMKKVEAGT